MFLAKVIESLNRENTYNYIARTNLNRNFPKINFKIYILLYSIWDKCLKLGSYVLGTKTKLLIEPIFDLGLRSENIEFLKFYIFTSEAYIKNRLYRKFCFGSKF